MGNGASCTKVEQFDESVQMPSLSPIKRPSTSSSVLQPYNNPLSKPSSAFPVQDERFEVKKDTDQYSTVWDFNTKVSL